MNFFEDLSKTLSGKGKEAVNKAKGLTDVIKLKTQLISEKNKLDEVFQEIGHMYFEQCQEDEMSEEFRSEILTARMLKSRIDALEEEICDMEGCRTCPACGAKLSQEDAFCSKCGAKMPEKPTKTESDSDDIFETEEETFFESEVSVESVLDEAETEADVETKAEAETKIESEETVTVEAEEEEKTADAVCEAEEGEKPADAICETAKNETSEPSVCEMTASEETEQEETVTSSVE